jgi:hypothetical protein
MATAVAPLSREWAAVVTPSGRVIPIRLRLQWRGWIQQLPLGAIVALVREVLAGEVPLLGLRRHVDIKARADLVSTCQIRLIDSLIRLGARMVYSDVPQFRRIVSERSRSEGLRAIRTRVGPRWRHLPARQAGAAPDGKRVPNAGSA